MKSNMYEGTKTWNPHVGCYFECVYCRPSFQRQLKRQRCSKCKKYKPHFHRERLKRIPNRKTIFVCGTGDIATCRFEDIMEILDALRRHAITHPMTHYYFQSKYPQIFEQFLDRLPKKSILLTTLETNYDQDYVRYSLAPPPSRRWADFKALKWPRKIVTVEPIMEFDYKQFLDMIVDIAPEAVYIGYNTRPKEVKLPEPSEEKVWKLITGLVMNGITVKPKDLRGLHNKISTSTMEGTS